MSKCSYRRVEYTEEKEEIRRRSSACSQYTAYRGAEEKEEI